MKDPSLVEDASAWSAHLHAWVRERAGTHAHVALFGPAPEWAALLELGPIGVLQVMPDLDGLAAAGRPPPAEVLRALVRFAPTHVVLPLAAGGALPAWLEALRREVPGAEVLFGFWNAGSATRFLATLEGRASGRTGPSDAEVSRTLGALGFEVRQRLAIAAPPGRSGLARPAEDALQSLLCQLEASAGADLLFYAVAPGPALASAPLVPGLLSVVVRADAASRPGLLDETLFSLACQEHQPLEVLLLEDPASAGGAEVERHQELGGFALQRIVGSRPGAWSEALRHARGQYVAFLDAGTVVYPAHYPRLITALHEGSSAWSMARAFRATCAPGAPGEVPHITGKRPFPLGEHLEFSHLREEPELLQALLVDRTRVGTLDLAPDAPDAAGVGLPVRLAALFTPVFLAEGLATCEVRSFSTAPPATGSPAVDVQVLRPLGALEAGLARARAEGASARGLRFQVIDDLNTRLRERLPWLHGALRSLAGPRG